MTRSWIDGKGVNVGWVEDEAIIVTVAMERSGLESTGVYDGLGVAVKTNVTKMTAVTHLGQQWRKKRTENSVTVSNKEERGEATTE